MENTELTQRQEEVLTFIKKFMASHGFSPSIREICEAINLSSPSTVFVHLKNLEKKGYIKQADKKYRAIELKVNNEYTNNIIKVPIYNSNEFLLLPNSITDDQEVFIYISEYDLKEENIIKKDYLIISKETNYTNNDLFLYIKNNNVFIEHFNNIKKDEYNTILGKVIGIYRKY